MYVVLVVVIAVPCVHTALMATCMASDWLAALVTMWMVLFWAVVLLVIAEDDLVVAASFVELNESVYSIIVVVARATMVSLQGFCKVDALVASGYPKGQPEKYGSSEPAGDLRVWT